MRKSKDRILHVDLWVEWFAETNDIWITSNAVPIDEMTAIGGQILKMFINKFDLCMCIIQKIYAACQVW